MTEVYINGKLAVLMEDFNFNLIFENPYFKGISDYSYDIELPMPANFGIFGHINILNIKKKRTFYEMEIRINGRVVIRGTAVVISVTERSVKVQIASGNSQMNMVYNDRYIDEMDMIHTVDVPLKSKIYTEISETDRDRYIGDESKTDFVYLPYLNQDNVLRNCVYYNRSNRNDSSKNSIRIKYDECAPMPYFRFLIKEVFKTIGYTLNEDIFDDNPVYQGLYVCRAFLISNQADKYRINLKEYLPHWTFTELIKQLEIFFVAYAVIDETNKEITFVSLSDYYTDGKTEYIDDIIREYDVDVNEEAEENDIKAAVVKYDMENTDNLDMLDKELVESAHNMAFPTILYLYDYFAGQEKKNYNELYSAEGRNYIAWDNGRDYDPYPGYESYDRYELKEVNLWNSRDKTVDSQSELLLSICPVKMKKYLYRVSDWKPEASFTTENYKILINVPYITEERFYEKEEVNLQASLQGNAGHEKKTWKSIPLAYNDGYKKTQSNNGKWGIYEYMMNYMYTDCMQRDNHLITQLTKSLSLRVSITDCIGKRLDIDNTMYSNIEYHIDFHKSYIPSATHIYIIRNKKYICRKIEVKVTTEGMAPILEGTFYRIE